MQPNGSGIVIHEMRQMIIIPKLVRKKTAECVRGRQFQRLFSAENILDTILHSKRQNKALTLNLE
jgi:hypothetical protein